MGTHNPNPFWEIRRVSLRIIQACRNIVSSITNIGITLALGIAIYLLEKKYISSLKKPYTISASIDFYLGLTVSILLIILIVLAYVLIIGGDLKDRKYSSYFRKIHLQNHLGETPIYLHSERSGNILKIFFYSSGISLSEYENAKLELESVFNISIIKIEEGHSRNYINILATPGILSFPDKIYVSNNDFDSSSTLLLGTDGFSHVNVDLTIFPHILLGGATGSGKTELLKLLLYQCIYKEYDVIISDFKGGVDYNQAWRKQCEIITDLPTLQARLKQVINELERRKHLFTAEGFYCIEDFNSRRDSQLKPIVFACDEIAELLDKKGLTKEQKEPLLNIEYMLSTIARQGRAFGIHLFLATQRPDADILSGQIKNNITYKVCGRADDVLSMIVLDNTLASREIKNSEIGVFINQDGTKFKGYLLYDELR